MPSKTRTTTNPETHCSNLQEMGWNEIENPGCYLVKATGDLLRVPQEALAPGHSPFISVTSSQEIRVAKLSDNPATPISPLRRIAADNDFFVNF